MIRNRLLATGIIGFAVSRRGYVTPAGSHDVFMTRSNCTPARAVPGRRRRAAVSSLGNDPIRDEQQSSCRNQDIAASAMGDSDKDLAPRAGPPDCVQWCLNGSPDKIYDLINDHVKHRAPHYPGARADALQDQSHERRFTKLHVR
jgi:hypothetical protein